MAGPGVAWEFPPHDEAPGAEQTNGAAPEADQQNGAAPTSAYDLGDEWNADLITGPAPPIEWIVQGALPRGAPCLLAAMGDVGKSFKLLELCLRVATYDHHRELLAHPIFGGSIVAEGATVFLTANQGTIHRRLEALDPNERRRLFPGRIKIVTVPDAGGPKPLITASPKGELETTDDFKRLREGLMKINDLGVFSLDPTQAFIHADINADPAAGQFFCSTLATLAAETGSCVLASHHMRKSTEKGGIKTLAEARAHIRGTSALVDGVRVAHVLFPAPDAEAKKDCKALDTPWQANRVVWGGVAKGNEIAGRSIQHYFRTDAGLLVDRTADLKRHRPDKENLEGELVAAIAHAANVGHPFTKTGIDGLYEQRARLSTELRTTARDRLEPVCQDLLDSGRIVRAKGPGSTAVKWLDVPGGLFARGEGVFVEGAPQ